MDVEYSLQQVQEQIAAVDESLDEAAQSAGLPLHIRVQPQILLRRPGHVHARYFAWRAVHWNLRLIDVREAQLFRDAMVRFFEVLGAIGPGRLLKGLDSLKVAAVESPTTSGNDASTSQHANA